MGKIVVITGADMGIGKCTADMYRSKGDIALSLSLGIDEEYRDYSYICDVTNEEAVQALVQQIEQEVYKILNRFNFETIETFKSFNELFDYISEE